MGAINVVEEVPVDGVDEKQFAVLVPVVSPRIGGAVGEGFVASGVRGVSPDSTADGSVLFGWSAGWADFTGGGSSAATVEPSVWSPAQAIGEIMVVTRRDVKAIKEDSRCFVGYVIPIGVRVKIEARWAEDVDSVRAPLDAGESVETAGKYFAFIMNSVAIVISEDEDAILY